MKFEPARSRVELFYNGDYGWYDKFSDDDYVDHEFESGVYLLLGESSGLDIIGSYEDAHEDRGTGLTEGFDPNTGNFPQDPDRYKTQRVISRYTYGVSRTRAYMTLEASAQDLTYKNNRSRTEQFDRENVYGKGILGIRIQPRISVQISATARNIKYKHPRASGIDVDSRENRYLLGIEWEASTTTKGYARAGWVEKNFEDPARPNFSSPNWELALRWSPRTYSHFDLAAERYADEPVDLLGDVTDTEIYSLSWSHEWNDRLESRMAVSELDRTFRLATGEREDKSPQYSAALIYKMRPWLQWEVGVDINARDSDVARYNYDQTEALLGARVIF